MRDKSRRLRIHWRRSRLVASRGTRADEHDPPAEVFRWVMTVHIRTLARINGTDYFPQRNAFVRLQGLPTPEHQHATFTVHGNGFSTAHKRTRAKPAFLRGPTSFVFRCRDFNRLRSQRGVRAALMQKINGLSANQAAFIRGGVD